MRDFQTGKAMFSSGLIITAYTILGVVLGLSMLGSLVLSLGAAGFCLLCILSRQRPQLATLLFIIAFTAQYSREFTASYLPLGGSRLYLLDVCMVVMFVVLAEKVVRKAIISRQSIHSFRLPYICLAIFHAVGVYSLLRGIPEYGSYAFGEFRMVFCSVFFFFVLSEFTEVAKIKSLIKTLTICTLSLPLYTFYNIVTNAPTKNLFLQGRFIHHHQALYAIFGIVAMCVFGKVIVRQVVWRSIWLSGLILTVVASGVRSAWTAGAISLALTAWLVRDKRNLIPILTFLVGLSVIVLSGSIMPDSIGSYEKSIISSPVGRNVVRFFNDFLEGSEGNTAKWRLNAWRQTIKERVIPNPIFGSPMGSYFEVEAHGEEIHYYRLPSHNSYVDIASKMGVLGLASFVILVCYYLLKGIHVVVAKRLEEDVNQCLSFFIVCTLGLLIYMGFDSVFVGGGSMCGILVWPFLAIIHNLISRG